jgi:heat shock protein HslJ
MGFSTSRRGWQMRDHGRALLLSFLAAASLLAAMPSAVVAQTEFPFDREMILDTMPLAGSKRVPILEISAQSRAQIDLWCKSGEGQVEVKGDTIKFTLGPLQDASAAACTPERVQRDEGMIAALSQVTHWRQEEDVIVLEGPTPLRFRLSTH